MFVLCCRVVIMMLHLTGLGWGVGSVGATVMVISELREIPRGALYKGDVRSGHGPVPKLHK